MKIIQYTPRDLGSLRLEDAPDPSPANGEVLIHVAATALNRSDILQVKGHYPAPEDASPVLGLEVAGTVIEVGPGVDNFEIGDNVCALVNGGGFAQLAVVPATMLLRLPELLSFTKAAAIPEVWLTAYHALHKVAGIAEGQTVLIHAGASGVGTAAIQLVRKAGGIPVVTASAMKHNRLHQLGAEHCIDYRKEDFAEAIEQITDGRGCALILDFIGAPYFQQNLTAAAQDAHIVGLGFMGGRFAERLDVSPIILKRLSLTGSTLRNRSMAFKQQLTADFRQEIWPDFANRDLIAVVDTIYDWEEANAAIGYMDSNANVGKIVITIGE
ncbi:MAG: NAD(P)H-quinone oxidoreductase [Bacteroidota bacterium]